MPGPIPKRDTDRVRRNKPDTPTKIGVALPAKRPPEERSWNTTAKRLYRSLKDSGQTTFWQQSDWEYARLTMDQLSKMLDSAGDKPLRAGQLAEINQMMSRLMFTEPDRRRARIELLQAAEGGGDDPATVTDINQVRGIYG
ncbi:phage terminase small subunit [Corynebacterium flavescens]|uniref:phage terminase small subunit n=1 Tax=Corynebacterium flavescens TaxID=28028 RepID=UPI0028984029|nr:hypothetical protein [Corynebacterium flavescens]